MFNGGSDRLRQLALVVLAASFVLAAALAVRAGTGSDDGSGGDGARIEAIGDLPSAERSSGRSDATDLASARSRSAGGDDAPDDQSSRLSATSILTAQSDRGSTQTSGATAAGSSTTTNAESTTSSTTSTTVETTTSTTERPTTTTTVVVVALTNGGFESADIPAGGYQLLKNGQVPGWTSDIGVFEVWHRDMEGVGSTDGSYLLELNSTEASTIHQDFATIPDTEIRWTFSHRGRDGKDEMELLIGPSDGKLKSVKKVKTGRDWKQYSGTYDVPEGQTSTRIAFRALESGSEGNLLDGIQVSLES